MPARAMSATRIGPMKRVKPGDPEYKELEQAWLVNKKSKQFNAGTLTVRVANTETGVEFIVNGSALGDGYSEVSLKIG